MLGNAQKTIIENFERIYRDLLMYNTKAKSPHLRTTRSLNIHLSHASLTSYSMECSGVFMLAAVPLVLIYRYPTQYFWCYICSIGLKSSTMIIPPPFSSRLGTGNGGVKAHHPTKIIKSVSCNNIAVTMKKVVEILNQHHEYRPTLPVTTL